MIKAKKTITSVGEWQSGKMPRTAFPLSKSGNKAYRLSNRKWRIVKFRIDTLEFRLLINFNPSLEQYQAMPGMTHGTDTKVLASLEFHGTHPSWHVHGCCDELDSVPAGIKRGPWVTRLPHARKYNRTAPFGITESNAYNKAIDFFGLDNTEDSDDKHTGVLC